MEAGRTIPKSLGWLVVPLLIAALIALCVTGAYPATKVETPIKPSEIQSNAVNRQNLVNSNQETFVRFDERIKDLESSQKASAMAWLEGQRKTIDWWLAFLGIMVAALALLGALIPYLMGLKNRDLIEATLREARQAAEQARDHQRIAEAQAREATEYAATAKSNAEQSDKLREALAGQEQSEGVKQELKTAAEDVRKDPQAGVADKLRADALAAGSNDDVENAYRLWSAVLVLDPKDNAAAFNAGFWANRLGAANPLAERFWRQQAATHYARALELKPDMHIAANNWGITLQANAKLLAKVDLPKARELWKQAGDKYAQALAIKPDMFEAIVHWGNALQAEADAVAKDDLPEARKLWAASREKYAEAVKLKNGYFDASFNWGIALGKEARALEPIDPTEALKFWRSAIEKYKALHEDKPEEERIFNNLASALMREQALIADTNAEAARALIAEAKALLLKLSGKNPSMAAYNLACCFAVEKDVSSSLAWLEISKNSGALPSKIEIEEDVDFDLIRNDPSFSKWFSALDN